ncbi:fasciclin domain-containing protein [Brevundimonas sp.]|uniref:fasciclin domain-containing protein n=1 Tax=Brevundimonas sp. TaxID=1871086 RepID=UPI0025DF82C4|nr:fasciclin domain-containing protein [Brevundimonas sp.]
MRKMMLWAAAPLVLLTTAACQRVEETPAEAGTGMAEPSSRTLAAGLDADHDGFNALVESSGLAPVLEGVGPYTVFVPSDAALQGAGDLDDEAMSAQAAALLRAHIVPGSSTRDDILAALERESSGQVQMRTMADTLLTFTREGETVIVTAPDGSSGRLTGEETVASNGVIQPVDGLLVAAGEASTATAGG